MIVSIFHRLFLKRYPTKFDTSILSAICDLDTDARGVKIYTYLIKTEESEPTISRIMTSLDRLEARGYVFDTLQPTRARVWALTQKGKEWLM